MARASRRREQERARDEIDRLFALAATVPQGLADRYVALARKSASRLRVSLRRHNRVHCRKCCAYWTSRTLRVRKRQTAVVYTCLRCGAMKRFSAAGSRSRPQGRAAAGRSPRRA